MDWAPVAYMPAQGYMASVARDQVPRGFVTGDSLNMRRRPLDGAWVRRPGTAIAGDSLSPTIGCLEEKLGAKARHIIAIESTTFSTQYNSYAVMFTDEADKEGQLYAYNPNTAAHWSLGRNYGTTHYPTTTNVTSDRDFKWYNLWCENSTQKLTRGTSATARRYVGAGTRKMLYNGKSLLLPSLQGTPLEWYGMEFIPSTLPGSAVERVRPWGRIPPLFCPKFDRADLVVGSGPEVTWAGGDAFFCSVMFQYEDGSYSKPFVPQQRYDMDSATTGYYAVQFSNRFGYVEIPVGGNYKSITWSGIPIGPPGVTARILLRSAKASTTSGQIPAPGELFVCAVIPNNSATTYVDTNGHDSALLPIESTPFVHFRYAWPMRARYAFEFDGRIGLGYLKQNPAAIILCVTGAPHTTTDLDDSLEYNVDSASLATDSDNTFTGAFYAFRIYDNAGTYTLQLRYTTGTGVAYTTAEITLTSAKKVRDIVDEINQTLTYSNTVGEWRAQLVPGADGDAPANKLALTDGVDHGDDSVTGGTTGNIRCWNNAWPGIIYFDHTWLDGMPTYKARFMHTESGPEMKQFGTYGSAFSWAVGPAWNVTPPEDAGIFMGARQLLDGCVVFYSKCVYLYRNIRDGRTGADVDYRLDKISSKGCIAWDSITGGNDWVGWLSEEGFMVTDGRKGVEHCLTYALYDPSSGVGDLGYEITQCRYATASDTDTADFHAAVLGDRLFITYRTAASTYRMHEYDFSETSGASGLSQILTNDGAPYGWSTPFNLKIGAMGAVRKSTKLQMLGAYQEANTAYSTGDGRINEFNVGTQDDGVAINTKLYTLTDDFGSHDRKKRMRRFAITHRGTAGATYVYLYRNRARTSSTSYLLSDSGVSIALTDKLRVKLDGQSPSETYEFYIVNDGSGTVHEVHDLTAEVRLLQTR